MTPLNHQDCQNLIVLLNRAPVTTNDETMVKAGLIQKLDTMYGELTGRIPAPTIPPEAHRDDYVAKPAALDSSGG